MTTTRHLGRVFLLRWDGPLDGSGPAPAQVAAGAVCADARFLLLDLSHVPFADSGGLRWLLALTGETAAAGLGLRVAARPGGKVRRNLALLQAGLELYDSVARAWKAPLLRDAAPAGRSSSGPGVARPPAAAGRSR